MAGRPLFSPGPVNEVSSDVPDGTLYDFLICTYSISKMAERESVEFDRGDELGGLDQVALLHQGQK